MRWNVACEVQDVKTELWSVKKVCSWSCNARLSHAGHVPGRQKCNTLAHSAHARASLAHGACKFYRCEKFYNISLRQLPPRLVRVLLVYVYIQSYTKISPFFWIKRWIELEIYKWANKGGEADKHINEEIPEQIDANHILVSLSPRKSLKCM